MNGAKMVINFKREASSLRDDPMRETSATITTEENIDYTILSPRADG